MRIDDFEDVGQFFPYVRGRVQFQRFLDQLVFQRALQPLAGYLLHVRRLPFPAHDLRYPVPHQLAHTS